MSRRVLEERQREPPSPSVPLCLRGEYQRALHEKHRLLREAALEFRRTFIFTTETQRHREDGDPDLCLTTNHCRL